MNSVRLYSDQDQFIRWIPEKEAKRLHLLNAIDDRTERGKFTGVRLKGFAPALWNSSTSITAADSRANVGETKEFSPGRVKQAQAKIEVWPKIGDDKAVCLRAGGKVFWPKGVRRYESA